MFFISILVALSLLPMNNAINLQAHFNKFKKEKKIEHEHKYMHTYARFHAMPTI